MKNYLIFTVFVIALLCCCSKEKEKEKNTKGDSLNTEVSKKVIPIYSPSSNTLNKLSDIAEDISFITLDNKALISAFNVIDVALSDDYIFLITLYETLQFDKNGVFIRYISKRGQGPREFLQLSSPMGVDEENKLLYLLDVRGNKILVYDFDGHFHHSIKIKSEDASLYVINSNTLRLNQLFSYRFSSDIKYLSRFINSKNGAEISHLKSSLYPLDKRDMETFGTSTTCFQWKYNDSNYFLEYGSDTIYRIENTKLIFDRVLTGKLKIKFENLFNKKNGKKLRISSWVSHPMMSFIESDNFFIVRVRNDEESFFSIFDKVTGRVFHTNHEESYIEAEMNVDKAYFIDDVISGFYFNPLYQSKGRCVGLIPQDIIDENKERFLSFIEEHPSEKGEALKRYFEVMGKECNPVLFVVKLK